MIIYQKHKKYPSLSKSLNCHPSTVPEIQIVSHEIVAWRERGKLVKFIYIAFQIYKTYPPKKWKLAEY